VVLLKMDDELIVANRTDAPFTDLQLPVVSSKECANKSDELQRLKLSLDAARQEAQLLQMENAQLRKELTVMTQSNADYRQAQKDVTKEYDALDQKLKMQTSMQQQQVLPVMHVTTNGKAQLPDAEYDKRPLGNESEIRAVEEVFDKEPPDEGCWSDGARPFDTPGMPYMRNDPPDKPAEESSTARTAWRRRSKRSRRHTYDQPYV
jgi:hypothetical protein